LNQKKQTGGRRGVSGRQTKLAVVVGCLLAALLLSGLALGFYQSWHHRDSQSGPAAGQVKGFEEDQLSVTSESRNVAGESRQPVSGKAASAQESENRDTRQRQLAAQQQAAQQQTVVQAALAEKQRELELQAAAQAAQERQLEQDRARVAAEKQLADSTAAEAERKRIAAAAQAERLRQQAFANLPQPTSYSGPSSGNIVWQGEVQGTALVTIDGNVSDTGQVVSGGLPGVLVMVQPSDAKHVGVAGAPAPTNSYRRLTLRIQGKGLMQETIHWSVP
jgi:hypothetical protein